MSLVPLAGQAGVPAGVLGTSCYLQQENGQKGRFCRDTDRVSQGRPAIQGVSEILCDFFLCAFSRVFLNPWFGEPVVCTLDSHGFRHFRGFRDFRESSTQLLVCSCLNCRLRDFRRFRGRRPAPKP